MTNVGMERRIAFVLGSMGRGGAERVVSLLANEFATQGWAVHILTLLDDRVDYELHDGVKVIPLCGGGRSRVQQLPHWIYRVRQHVRSTKPEVVVSFVARVNIVTLVACFGLRQRVIISERNDPAGDGRSLIVKFVTRLLYPMANCVVFQTRWAQSCFPKRIQRLSAIIPNPIRVHVESCRVDSKKIVSVGRLVEQKNHKLLIDAFSAVHERYPEYRLYIYGEGHLRQELEMQIRALGLSGTVFLPGVVPDVHSRIADAEMFVLSSDYEGLSNALLEAMMIGLPCISTDCAGSNEIIIHGENGLLVPVGDRVALAKAMITLIENPVLRLKVGDKSRDTVRRFNADEVLQEWNRVLLSSN